MDIFVFAGQSPMKGSFYPPTNQAMDEDILKLTGPDTWKVACEPVCIGSDRYSPCMAFARKLKALMGGDYPMGLINGAVGGTGIGWWQERQPCFENLVGLVNGQTRGVVKGLIFWQGPRDAVISPLSHAADWDVMFLRFCDAFRDAVGQADLPVVFTQEGKPPPDKQHPNWMTVHARQAAAALALRRGSIVHTWDVATGLDGIHYPVASEDLIGERMARAMRGWL